MNDRNRRFGALCPRASGRPPSPREPARQNRR